MRHAVVGVVALVWLVVLGTSTQSTQQPASAPAAPARIDFVRDVQPIFRQHCYGCHGPTQQMNGFRLDRRSHAMRGGTATMIGPGNSEGSRLYLYLKDSTFGPQMPITGPLAPEQIATIKAWIDQGAVWPDEASGEEDPAPIDPAAVRVVQMLRAGDEAGVRASVAKAPSLVNARGPGGATPLMFTALYGSPALMVEMIDRGGNVNAANDAGATPLIWAATRPDIARLLIERGADVNVKTADGRTALMIAAGDHGSRETVTRLLEKGADVRVVGPSLFGPLTALSEAAMAGNEEIFKLLVTAGADLKAESAAALGLSFRSGCMSCAEAFMKVFSREQLTAAMVGGGPPTGPALATPLFMKLGADIHAKDPNGRSMLMLAAASEAMPVDAVKALLGAKLDVNARAANGDTALNLARRHGQTPIVSLLLEAGAADEAPPAPPSSSPAPSARAAIERSLPLLQKSDVTFLRKSGCVSCHNNSLTSMSLAAARKQKLRVDETIARAQTQKIGAYLESWRERAIQRIAIPGEADTVSYILLGLAAEGHAPDLATDAQALLLKQVQAPDGSWRLLALRPPIESSVFEVTAASMRALQVYAPPARRADYEPVIAAAAAWLRKAAPRSTEDRAFQLLGMHWSKTPAEAIAQAGKALAAEQRADGGWSQIPSLGSDAYATGQALVALVESGAMTTTSDTYRRGAAFLLKTQLADGTWYVRSRAVPLQPLFDADFPHGPDAFISAAATNWAVAALALAPDTQATTTAGR